MRKFTVILFVINLAVFLWLVAGAKMELPPWQKAFDDLESTINEVEVTDEATAVEWAVLQSRFQSAETFARITIREYRRSNGPLVALVVINILGFSIIVFKNRNKPKQSGGECSAGSVNHLNRWPPK